MNFISSVYRVIFVSMLLITYSYYRFFDHNYLFINYTFFKPWKYLDIIILFTIAEISVFVRQIIRESYSRYSLESLFEIDDPIQVKDEDLLNRATLSIELANKIIGTNGNNSIAIGITGKWGSGKTSFMNLLKEQFKNHQDIIIDFNPWKSLNHEVLIRDFFKTLSSQLEKYSFTVSKEINEYASELLQSNNQSWSQGIKSFLNLDSTIDLEDRFQSINETLKKLNKNVVIIIDDVDRLDKKEIIELLKLIRNTGSFNRIKFLVAFDREYVINSITESNSYSSSKYLDKIFLQMVELPPISSKELTQLLSKKIAQHFPEVKSKIEYMIDREIYKETSYIEKVITSIRDIKRFIIHFIPEYKKIKGEIEFEEYFNLSLLHYKFPSVYWELYLNPSIYLQNNGYLKKDPDKSNKESISVLQKVLESEKNKFSFDNHEIRTLINLITNIFPDKNFTDSPGHLSVRRVVNFDKYFISRLNSSDLSEVEFQNGTKGNLNDLKIAIDQWCYDCKKLLLMTRFKALDIRELESKDDFEKIIQAIVYLGTKKNRIMDRTMVKYGYFDDDFYYKLNDTNHYLSKQFYNNNSEDYKQFLLSIFKTSEQPYRFLAEFASYMIRNEYLLESFPLSKNDLTEITLNYFKCYLKFASIPDDRIWDLYHCCNTFLYENDKKYMVPNKEANKIFIEYIYSNSINLKWFVQSVITNERRNQNHFYLSRIIKDIFDSFDQFKLTFCDSKILGSDYQMEFELFLNRSAEAKYQAIEFQFEVIPIKEN
ncbi:P-loop NTPase fold protein [Fluviicola sp.]|uniref:KAP family P-loop NTPase fold protein n=1 Tax=Fluviicola sp. TaxID=1917219 RepID=UPI0031D353C5